MDKKFILYLIIIILLGFSFSKIFYPAWLSYGLRCDILTNEQLSEKGYYTAGSFTANISDSGETTTEIIIVEEDVGILQHEYCHLKQFESSRIYDCSMAPFAYLNEVECYGAQYMPKFIYEKLYYDLKSFA